jgi:hypothetical protein
MSSQPPAQHSRAHLGRLPLGAAVVVAVVCGVLMAVQSRINGELGRQLGDGFSAVVTLIPRSRGRRMQELLGRAEIEAEMITVAPGDALIGQLSADQ